MRAGCQVFVTCLAIFFCGARDAHADDTVDVHIDGDPAIVLERAIIGTGLWESVCVGACDFSAPRDGRYRITGRGIRPSLPFALLPERKLRLEVNTVYSSGWVGSVLMTVLGPAVAIGGLFAMLAGSAQVEEETPPCPEDVPCGGTSSSTAPSNARVIGGGLAVGIGVTMTVVGIVGLLVGDHSTLRQLTITPRSASISF